MELKSPDDYGSCSFGDYFGYLILSVLPAALACLFILFCCCPGCCIFRCLCSFKKEREGLISNPLGAILLSLIFLVVIAGSITAWIGSDEVHVFTFEARDIFTTRTDYIHDTLDSSISSLRTLNYTTQFPSSYYATAKDNAKKLTSKTDDFASQLEALDAVRITALSVALGLSLLCISIGILAAFQYWHRCSVCLGFLALFCGLGLWGNFTVMYVASNILYDMCDVINDCHFCYAEHTGDFPNCTACKTNWFAEMKDCKEEASSRFSSVVNISKYGGQTAANAACSNITQLCTQETYNVTCINTENCTLQNLQQHGLTTVVCPDATPGTCYTIPQLAKMNTPVQSLCQEIVDNQDLIMAYVGVDTDLATMDCAAPESILEIDPDGNPYIASGVYDSLQKHLCPKNIDPVYTIYDAIDFTSAGLLVCGFVVMLAAVILVCGFRPPGSGDYSFLKDETELSVNSRGLFGK
eukprot:CAMPEP_0174264542 /NCGR_PEP_ID=MMETSP0439-20130205/22775_1 /TAXON_ID=0 /ORGANISM="Stereomyxa ramosa, Strain Chinc5" /LENGTH=467 /DNA_ID=CAMNT_0015350453 /DNA_START=116 /DNA_END=1519 /DNA_ORIENTATION=-